MNFIKNVVSTLNFPDRLRAEGGYTGEFNWNSGLSINQMQSNIDSAQQNPQSYSLSQQAASLLTSIEVLENDNNDPIAALIFISDTSDSALRNSDRWFSKLSNIQITFVLLGTNVDSLKLRSFGSNFIYWPDLALSQPDSWDLLFNNAFGCSGSGPAPTPGGLPTIPTLPTISNTATTCPCPLTTETSYTSFTGTTQTPYIPCNSWISFGIDNTMALNSSAYLTQRAFISNAIGALNHPERLQLIDFSSGVYERWNNYDTITQIQLNVLSIPQEYSYHPLQSQFGALATQYTKLYSYGNPVAAIIFISNTTDAAIAGADQYISFLKGVKITFVMLGSNVDSTKLIKFSSNFIYWSDLSQPQPENWDSLSYSAYGCDGKNNKHF
uniref:VWFA domain-containing protein n=1 Tax=Panagrolaimus davidi TaxID=227884 RepID=A0A914QBR9_9BILA